ncbi:MAG: response regulator [Elusimicrobia bacterium]|nr:response regulator [Elusimicrobiota bacterium]
MPKVMIIDDEKDLVYLLKIVFEKEGFEVSEAFDGNEAYEKLSAVDNMDDIPDVILLDVMMPEMDGYTLQAKLQENEKFNKIPIIILTAKGQMRDLFELSSNVFAFVEKPFEPKNLLEMAKDAVNSRK